MAGIVLVTSLYLLNLTVTNGAINEIIFYANVVSITDSVFLVNKNVLKPLRVFISFANLDLGIETCFYNGMDSFKMWLQLFFPFYLIIIAASIIIASRYSYTWADLEKNLGGEPNKVGIKVAQLNVLLALQLRTSIVISQLPV